MQLAHHRIYLDRYHHRLLVDRQGLFLGNFLRHKGIYMQCHRGSNQIDQAKSPPGRRLFLMNFFDMRLFGSGWRRQTDLYLVDRMLG